ncbi:MULTISPECIES: type III-B CRISPR module RAMP protein Cmr1 [unclassified Thermosipho (in: thermotogales)]|uniref:type III-B CRISPR module RAMP protein Cmr1 n=1 Tax=unclassified Thermosipho (in: thermotogales) TaxID=2676525 RepID=UPI000986D56F|nr:MULTISPECIES: type III-B CRISPR module RAMP protein Cmr1 [unclassified Thermosipho (in: thermotogales)]MBT1247060.1 hypothetical protein [Thermosipho sp. 1244]OOC46914.1 hypothetical protein XO09_04335 [Thermosipho sp. 1223]
MYENLNFKCMVVTPMLCYGADKKYGLEIRAQSLKGVMRFWWRALNGHLSIDTLRKKEANIFGGVGKDDGKSKFSIKIVGVNGKTEYEYVLPHKKTFKRKAFIPYETSFNVEMKFWKKDEELVTTIKDLFILISILGGVGRRTRRGFGSFKIIEINGENFDYEKYVDLEKMANLMNKISKSEHFSVEKNDKSSKIKTKFCKKENKYPYVKFIEFGKEYDNYDELLKKISTASHNHNSDFTGYAKNGKRLASPVYVSVVEKDNNFIPVVTQLELSEDVEGIDRSKEFIREVLG